MSKTSKHGESHWLICPQCREKTRIKLFDDSVLLNFPLFCTRCKKETVIGVLNKKMVVSE